MKTLTKMFAALLVISTLFLFVSCGDDTTGTTTEAASGTTTEAASGATTEVATGATVEAN